MAGIKGQGTAMTFGGVAVPNTRQIDIPEMDREDVDITTNDSPDSTREYVGGYKEPGTMTVSGLFLSDDTNPLFADDDDGAPKAVIVTLSDGGTFTFDAVLKGAGVSAGYEGAVEYTASLKISGTVTQAAGA